MRRYIIIPNPGHNRIYFNSSIKIAKLELMAMFEKLHFIEIEEKQINSVKVLLFCCEETLSDDDLVNLGRLSLYYILLEIVDEELLKIVNVNDFRSFPDSFNQILRYNGKTNEQFTRLMLNIARSTCRTKTHQLKLLDPMCGKATTLIEGLIQGFNVEGIEINKKVIKEVETFMLRYLKEGRYKHNTRTETISIGTKKVGSIFEINTAKDKELYSKGILQNFRLINADTMQLSDILKKNTIDILVCDLPYGVQHGTKLEGNMKTSRKPIELLVQCCKGWNMVMKKGGAVVLAYNEFTIKQTEIASVLEEAGFNVLKDDIYTEYRHRVAQAIQRNIVVAIK